MSQVEVASTTSRQIKAPAAKERVEAFLKTFEWTWTKAVIFSLALVVLHHDHDRR